MEIRPTQPIDGLCGEEDYSCRLLSALAYISSKAVSGQELDQLMLQALDIISEVMGVSHSKVVQRIEETAQVSDVVIVEGLLQTETFPTGAKLNKKLAQTLSAEHRALLERARARTADLRAAHDRNDETLERIYIGRRFKNDTERLEKLFEMYTQMTATDGGKATANGCSKDRFGL